MIEYQKSLQRVQCSTCASHEPRNGEAEGAKHKGGLEEVLIKSLQRVQLSAGSKLEAMRAEESAGILCSRSLFLKSEMRSPNLGDDKESN